MFLSRLFAAGSVLPHDETRFCARGGMEAPEEWSLEAVEAFREGLFLRAPLRLTAVEENTTPSWLWRRRATGEKTAPESEIMAVFTRIAGAAAYRGWKAGLWQSESEASVFFDEVRALLLTRRLVFAPRDLARIGLDWAYGAEKEKTEARREEEEAETASLILQNETIDAILGGGHAAARGKWMRFLETGAGRERSSVAFADTIAEWCALPASGAAPRASLNLMAFRHEDSSLDLEGLAQAARVAVLLLDLLYDDLAAPSPARPLALGFGGLADLLMSLALSYDSEAGRAVASALAALMTATAYETSAYLAEKLGPCAAYGASRACALRTLENQSRAAFGEKTDYDRLSVPPPALALESGVDLVLLSAARHAYEKARGRARAHGLRHLQLTSLYGDPSFPMMTGCFAQGIEAATALFCEAAVAEEVWEPRVNPALPLGLARLGYDRADIEAAKAHVAGYRTLIGAPGISRTLLREKGFDETALARLEKALTRASDLRLVFTPWILGEAFCREALRIPAKDLKNPAFDMLKFLGFSKKEIALASAFCCGHRRLRGLAEVAEKDLPVFAVREDLAPEAQIRMAAAVQSFVTGDVGLALSIPASVTAQLRGELILMGWRQGLRSLCLASDGAPPESASEKPGRTLMKRQTASPTGKARLAGLAPAPKAKVSSRALALKRRPGAGKEKRPSSR